MSIFERFGHVVRIQRIKQNMSQEEFAEICELHRTYISDVELGKRNLSLENIEKIAHALHVTLGDLFSEVDHYESI